MTTKILSKEALLAVYLRKSREDADTEDTLRKHREQLKEFIDMNGFVNVEWFEEVGSGESIEGRPVFSSLLPRIEAGEFDGVLVVHQDRLSRGSQAEAGRIMDAFEESETLIVTPHRTYDLSVEGDIMLTEFEGIISRNEYRAIKRRLRQGKINAVKDGRLHSGNPPFGYYWDRNTKTAEIDEEQSKIYRMIVEWYIHEGMSGQMIADRLNEMQVPTPRNATWHGESITTMLLNDFHRGYVWYGKLKARKNGKGSEKNTNPNEVYLNRGRHKPLKTEEEHAAIIKRLETLRKYNTKDRRVRKDTFRLSGLVYCPHCGKCQGIGKSGNRKEHLRKCLKKSTTRTKACDATKGLGEEIVFQAIVTQMRTYQDALFSPNEDRQEETENSLKDIVEFQYQAVERGKRRIDKVKEMFKNDLIDIRELKEEIAKEEAAIHEAESKISELKTSMGYLEKAEEKARLERWSSEEVSRLLEGDEMEASEVNAILRSVIERISYSIEDNELKVEILYK